MIINAILSAFYHPVESEGDDDSFGDPGCLDSGSCFRLGMADVPFPECPPRRCRRPALVPPASGDAFRHSKFIPLGRRLRHGLCERVVVDGTLVAVHAFLGVGGRLRFRVVGWLFLCVVGPCRDGALGLF